MSQPRRVPLRYVAAVFVGNGLEFYDFVTFSYFAVYIGRTFFPSHDPAVSLLASLATFGVGFLMRPVGAMVIGPMGDRIGRKPAMLFTFNVSSIFLVSSFIASGSGPTPSAARALAFCSALTAELLRISCSSFIALPTSFGLLRSDRIAIPSGMPTVPSLLCPDYRQAVSVVTPEIGARCQASE